MYLTCPACGKRLQLAEHALPPHRPMRVRCPACQERFTVELPPEPPASSPPEPPVAEALEAGTAVAAPPRGKPALVCLAEAAAREACSRLLTALGYVPQLVADATQAVAELERRPYALVVFDGTAPDNPVAAWLGKLPMERRRHLFAVLCAPEVTTADALRAYEHGVELSLNSAELASALPVLRQALAAQARLYRVYEEVCAQLGKEL
ncbi:MAG: hypothetical protein KatS3mg131_0488 [Candidatus Tectimicrobiota bacterium]|nr:MAG: hypothetical protein KatS3mg131_0488 [Candidatus Tectomicrobia bacterium]